jgi:hypothetical protein
MLGKFGRILKLGWGHHAVVDLQLHVSTAFVKFPSIHNMGGISLFGN